MKIIRNRYLPFGDKFAAINLFGALFVKPWARLDNQLINHERIHTAQMRELLYVFFYIIYVFEWLCRFIVAKGRVYASYRAISFEQEAYDNASNLGYLTNRPAYAQWRTRKRKL